MQPRSVSFGPFVFDAARVQLLREGAAVAINQRGLALLEALLEADGGVVTKAVLMDRAWPGLFVEENNLTVQIAALRKLLGNRPDGIEWITTVPRQGYRFARSSAEATEPGGPPAVAVLPFANLSGEVEQAQFADGVVADLIIALSRFTSFAVVSRSSSLAYRDRSVDVREVGRELGVRYVLEGSVQRRGTQIRVDAELVDARSGKHLWAQRFDGDLSLIFDFQDRITEAVAFQIEPEIRQAEIERARRKRPDSLDAYDLFVRALADLFHGQPADGFQSAISLLERAVALDPEFALAHAYLAWTYERRNTFGVRPVMRQNLVRCVELARTALKFGGDDPQVLAIGGFILLAFAGQRDEGLVMVRQAAAANPNSVAVLLCAGICDVLMDDLDEAIAYYRRAAQLSPNAPELHECHFGEGFALFNKQDFEGAVACLRRALFFNELSPTYFVLAAAYAHLGRLPEAHAALANLERLVPGITLADLQDWTMRDDRRELMLAGLRRAGLPEG